MAPRSPRGTSTTGSGSAPLHWGSHKWEPRHISGIKFGEYDATIASLIPHYKELIEAAAAAVERVAPTSPAVVDLGTGSGALAAAILKVRPKARLIGIDADASMLAAADRRLRGKNRHHRGQLRARSIPRCDVVSASFALHHIDTGRKKAALYKRCFAALRDGGMMVSADCFLAIERKAAQAPSRSVARAPAEEIHAEESGAIPAHVGEGRRLLHARSRARIIEGRGLLGRSDVAERQLRRRRWTEVDGLEARALAPGLRKLDDDDVEVAFLLFRRLPLDENRALVGAAQQHRHIGLAIRSRQEADAP